jgi:hypothetical protein
MAFEDLTPNARVVVSGVDLNDDMIAGVAEIEIDLSRDLADQIKLTVVNPQKDEFGVGYQNTFQAVDSKAWQPGNQVDIYLGYGDDLTYITSGMIQRWKPNFPKDGFPTLKLTALDASTRLMDGPFVGDARSFPGDVGFDYTDVATQICADYQIARGDVSSLLAPFMDTVTKKSGMTDYQFIRGLANLGAFEFKVFYDPISKLWKFNFRPPTTDQQKKYTFTYGPDSYTLLDFEPSWGLRDQPSEVKVLFLDKYSGIYQQVSSKGVSSKVKKATLSRVDQDGADFVPDMKWTDAGGVVDQEMLSLEKVRIATGGISVEVVPERPFPSIDFAETFAARWMKEHRDNFIVGTGHLVGLEAVRPGDVHRLEGIGVQLTGDWEFTTVNHKLAPGNGFVTEFTAHKVLVSD